MKRPSPEEVRSMMRPEVRWNFGTNRLIEAVELRSGIVVAEYRYVSRFTNEKGEHRYQRKLVFKPWWNRPPASFTVEAGYTNEYTSQGE